MGNKQYKQGEKVNTKGMTNAQGKSIDELIAKYYDDNCFCNRGEQWNAEATCNPLCCIYYEKSEHKGNLYRPWTGCISLCGCWGQCPLLFMDPRRLYNKDGSHQLISKLSIPTEQFHRALNTEITKDKIQSMPLGDGPNLATMVMEYV
jgi:hypothetical protein